MSRLVASNPSLRINDLNPSLGVVVCLSLVIVQGQESGNLEGVIGSTAVARPQQQLVVISSVSFVTASVSSHTDALTCHRGRGSAKRDGPVDQGCQSAPGVRACSRGGRRRGARGSGTA